MLASACADRDRAQLVADEPAEAVASAPTAVEADDATLVDACVQWVPIAAFSGDVDMVAVWEAANQDIAVLAEHCRALTTNRRLVLRQMADELRRGLPAGDPVESRTPVGAPIQDDDVDGSICAVIPASGETICVDT